ncbi:chromosomal replication initiator protein DnaA [Streptococcus sp. CSL7508-lung]|uniref:Chromosomal replication initiator protein DnaA n=2 Tax=Streptococcus zalophi TaxID=640031 RepID=A0A934PAW6_9STRE|nr:chromosomal replication initiator protein DnaA [Streptococcus zalophi]MBJ8350068.1 chromosomal replication initiator protein DnaA [Streptococcus zalophi]MCR8968156.1 chromosomal replication initiator protein DnaA [Streptococcus zalophi]
MMSNEQIFWNRLIELAQEKLRQTAFDYYIADAKLIKVENNVATIFIEEKNKKLFWEKNLKPAILTAGFEIYDAEITAEYVFEDFLTRTESTKQPDFLSQPTRPLQELTPVENDLNPKYRFDNFIQGPGSQWAFAAARAVAETPGITYNPLFIWGGPGLGKTHLLNAIGNFIVENDPKARIKYITTEEFISEYVTHIRLKTIDELKNQFRNLDVLLIDDIQSLAKKPGTQEEFFHTFNALRDKNKQIVLTSDRSPDQLNDLENRLVTRFSWGLTQDITPPEFETRVAILQEKIKEYTYDFPQETIEYLAGQFDSNVRELEGALKDINLVASTKKVSTITIELVVEAIRARKQEKPIIKVIPIEMIQEQVGKFYGVTTKEIKSTKRNQNIVLARQVAIFLVREMTDNSLPKIGKEFGGRDHSTVLYAYNKIKNMLAQDDNLMIEIKSIKNTIKQSCG